MADEPRFAFHPLERRGLLLGLDAGQLATIAAGAVAAVVAHAAVGGSLGVFVGLVLATGGLAAALWTRDGTPLGARATTGLIWVLRRPSRRLIDDSPRRGHALSRDGMISPLHGSGGAPHATVGAVPGSGGAPHGPARVVSRSATRGSSATRPCATAPPGIELIYDHGLPGESPLGVVRDRRSGCWAAAVPVRGCSFSLMDPAEQAGRLEGWRQVLGVLARPGSPVARVQWLQRSWTGAPMEVRPPHWAWEGPYREAGPSPVDSYRQLSAATETTMLRHHAWVVLAVRPSHSQPRGPLVGGGAVAQLRRELRLLSGQLREAALEPLDPLDLPRLEGLIAGAEQPSGSATPPPWPLAAADGWSAYRADGAWHATYWVAEWPRLPVGPDFLTPLLVGAERTSVSVVMAPVPADRAMREVRSARTADLADAELKSRAGFLQSARRERESAGVARRETELADGHQEFRFSGYVTVSAPDPERLAAACTATEHCAQGARLELRRLYGRQAEAYTWTLPLGRGLR